MADLQEQPKSDTQDKEDLSKALTQPLPKDLLLIVFIHGYCVLLTNGEMSNANAALKVSRERILLS